MARPRGPGVLFDSLNRKSLTNMAESNVKERVLEAVRELPDDATVEDAMERLYVLAKIQKGLEQADAGQTVSHEEAKRRVFG